ncbi:MAG: hypothetical protein ACK41O_26775, partial [Runella zeae]
LLDAADRLLPIATGRWGSGMFGGNKELKSLIQWLSASQAQRRLKYCSFGDQVLAQKLRQLDALLQKRQPQVTVAHVLSLVLQYREHMATEPSVIDFVQGRLMTSR